MSGEDRAGRRGRGDSDSQRITIEDAGGRRPFMRGILVHSLMAQGVSFEAAYQTANLVRERIRRGSVIPRAELAELVAKVLAEEKVSVEPHARPLPSTIEIVGDGEPTLPFSKGVLSQSLLAAALEPNQAFEVARQIEEELVAQGKDRVSRHDLRRLTFTTLGRVTNARVANRYLVWRTVQNDVRPVIVLLGGATGSGKTALALEVAHRLGIGRVISTDTIRQVMRITLSEELMPALHASSYDAYVRLGEPAPGADRVVEGFLAQTSAVSVGVKAVVDRAVEEGLSLVLDGVSIVPGRIDLGAWSERAHVIFLVVATFDEDAFRTRFERRGGRDSARSTGRYIANLDSILRIQEYILELAEVHGVPIVENVSFDRSVLSILRYVTEALGAKEDLDGSELL